MNNIQTHAYLSDKPNKARARQLLEQLYNQAPDGAYAELYKYFEVKPSKKPKSLEEWVNLARSSEAVKPQLHHTHYDGEYLTATDGHRLHRIKTKLPQVGYYHADGSYMYIEWKFPETQRVFPTPTYCFDFDMTLHCKIEDKNHYRLDVFNNVWFFKRNYLDQLMGETTKARLFTDYNDSRSAVHFIFDNREAILMPVKLQG